MLTVSQPGSGRAGRCGANICRDRGATLLHHLSLNKVTSAGFQPHSCLPLPPWFHLQGLRGVAPSSLLRGLGRGPPRAPLLGWGGGFPFSPSAPFSTEAASSSLAQAGLRPLKSLPAPHRHPLQGGVSRWGSAPHLGPAVIDVLRVA